MVMVELVAQRAERVRNVCGVSAERGEQGKEEQLYVVPSVPQCFSITAVECCPYVEVVVFPKHVFHAALITRGSTPGRNFCDVPRGKFFRVLERGGADEYIGHDHHLCVKKTKYNRTRMSVSHCIHHIGGRDSVQIQWYQESKTD